MNNSLSSFTDYTFPRFKHHELPRRLRKRCRFPKMTVNDLVSVQPMTREQARGSLYSLNFRCPTGEESARDALTREIRRRTPEPPIRGSGHEWRITTDEYLVLSMGDRRVIDAQEREGGELYFYYDIGFLSGSAGAFLRKEGKVVDLHTWMRA